MLTSDQPGFMSELLGDVLVHSALWVCSGVPVERPMAPTHAAKHYNHHGGYDALHRSIVGIIIAS